MEVKEVKFRAGNRLIEPIFSDSEAYTEKDVELDLSSAENGYVGIKNDKYPKVVLQVVGNITQNHHIRQREEPYIYPIPESGKYNFRVLKNIEDDKYTEMFHVEKDITLVDEFQPWLRPNEYVNYEDSSPVVEFAHGVYAFSENDKDFVNKIGEYITSRIVYDKDKIFTLENNYISDPNVTYKEEKGICMDYAVLAATMLRSQGIPTKVVIGHVEIKEKEEYHAWNRIYVDGEWQLYDFTFMAGGYSLESVRSEFNYHDEQYY